MIRLKKIKMTFQNPRHTSPPLKPPNFRTKQFFIKRTTKNLFQVRELHESPNLYICPNAKLSFPRVSEKNQSNETPS